LGFKKPKGEVYIRITLQKVEVIINVFVIVSSFYQNNKNKTPLKQLLGFKINAKY